eukprot:jgi/Mesvir1/23280/Mv20982-RA.1
MASAVSLVSVTSCMPLRAACNARSCQAPRTMARRSAITQAANGWANARFGSRGTAKAMELCVPKLGQSAPRGPLTARCNIQEVPAKTAYEMTKKGAIYLDVRTVEEFKQSAPVGAINIPVMNKGPMGMQPNPDFLAAVNKRFPDKTVDLVVGCLSGRRSQTAIAIMQQAEFTSLVNVEGGFTAWSGSGLPVEVPK